MKLFCIVDSINNIEHKIQTLKNEFDSKIIFIVKGEFETLFKTYGYEVNAVYSKDLNKVFQIYLSNIGDEDAIVYYSSLELNKELIQKFKSAIGNREKIVNVNPTYNSVEKIFNFEYNLYVKSLFKIRDSLSSKKLQFLPNGLLKDLSITHFGNRMFDFPELTKYVIIEDKTTNTMLKEKRKFDKNNLIFIVLALLLTIGLMLTTTFTKIKYWIVLIFILLFLLDFIIYKFYNFKKHFDNRFLK